MMLMVSKCRYSTSDFFLHELEMASHPRLRQISIGDPSFLFESILTM